MGSRRNNHCFRIRRIDTINGLAPAATYGPGTYTVVATAANGNAIEDCTATVTIESQSK
jgi:hypothetical protein